MVADTYRRKPFPVEAYLIKEDNVEELVKWAKSFGLLASFKRSGTGENSLYFFLGSTSEGSDGIVKANGSFFLIRKGEEFSFLGKELFLDDYELVCGREEFNG